MRLLKVSATGSISLTEHPSDLAPSYAILSHVWGDEEVSFEDINSGRGEKKAGYQKIHFCAEKARKDGLEYFWVDTCCINKADFTELSEAINSMFRWYRESKHCYVFLGDVWSRKRAYIDSADDVAQRTWERWFRESMWFTRGWTLQELLAPASVGFFSQEGELLGSKTSLASLIQEITGISRDALLGSPLSNFTIQERLGWGAGRKTTRPEDRAYCLLGLFDVFIAPIYGERNNAFVRLQDEICKKYGNRADNTESSLGQGTAVTPGPPVFRTGSSFRDNIQQQNDVEALLNFLRFEQMDSRRITIKSAYSTTCAWLLKAQTFMEWLDPDKFEQHRGLLWIKGKPGAGKSTIVKFAHDQASKQPRNGELLISYFFNAKGEVLERSTLGMYRSLLFQLFQKAGDLYQGDISIDVLRAPGFEWTIKQLRELFTSALRRLGPQRRIKCFIDALDECDEREIRDMIGHFEDVGSEGKLFTCFASRHYPSIIIRHGKQLILEAESGHNEDLIEYVHNHLKTGTGETLNELKTQVQKKANGVFMWAVLVIDILNEEYDRGWIFAVRKRLNEIPEKLSDLFRDILLRDKRDMDALLLCIQWVLFAKRPLKRKEFYYAMAAGLDSETDGDTEWDPDVVPLENMSKFVLSCSKGLAELTKPWTSPTVQFIHESVRDFLIKDGGLYELWPELRANPGLSHCQLRNCCQRYLGVDLTKYTPSTIALPKAKSREASLIRDTLYKRLPFLHYAADHVLYHANEAAKGTSEDDFLRTFDPKSWVLASNLTRQHEKDRHTENVSLVYLLAEQDLAQLIRQQNRLHKKVERTPYERYRHPLLVAIANRNWDAVRALLEPSNDSRLEEVMETLRIEPLAVGADASPLHWAIRKRIECLAKLLAAWPQADINIKDGQANTPLTLAAKHGYITIVQQLLRRGASATGVRVALSNATLTRQDEIPELPVNSGEEFSAEEGSLGKALYAATENGHQDIVELLLVSGSDTRVLMHDWLEKALAVASSGDNYTIVELLLDNGARVNAMKNRFSNPLENALRTGCEETVRLLVDAGADVNSSRSPDSPLVLAILSGRESMVKMLLHAGADVDYSGAFGNPLVIAVRNCRKDIVKVLLGAGADINSSRSFRDILFPEVQSSCESMLEILLNRSPDNGGFAVKNEPLVSAVRSGCESIVKTLLDDGADMNGSGSFENPLVSAVESSWESMVNTSMDAGANIHGSECLNNQLFLAIQGNCEAIIKILLDAGADINNPGPFKNLVSTVQRGRESMGTC